MTVTRICNELAIIEAILQAAARDTDWSDIIHGEHLTPAEARLADKTAFYGKCYGKRATIIKP